MTEKRNLIKLLLPFLTILILSITSCRNDIIYSETASMPEITWKLTDNPEFKFDVTDSVLRTNVFFTIRSGSSYPFRNIFLFTTTSSPDGRTVTDTLEFFIADDKGNRLGKGFGDIREQILPWKQNVFFPQKGTYRFRIQHGMRTEELKGIYDIGIRIEKFPG